MEQGRGARLSTRVPVRVRCLESPDSGCRCLGCLEAVSVSSALLRTEAGICPSSNIALETLTPALGMEARELPARVVSAGPGQLEVEWMELASTGVLAVLIEARLTGRGAAAPALGRVPFCARATATTA